MSGWRRWREAKNEKDGIGDDCDGAPVFGATGGCTCIRIGIEMMPHSIQFRSQCSLTFNQMSSWIDYLIRSSTSVTVWISRGPTDCHLPSQYIARSQGANARVPQNLFGTPPLLVGPDTFSYQFSWIGAFQRRIMSWVCSHPYRVAYHYDLLLKFSLTPYQNSRWID